MAKKKFRVKVRDVRFYEIDVDADDEEDARHDVESRDDLNQHEVADGTWEVTDVMRIDDIPT